MYYVQVAGEVCTGGKTFEAVLAAIGLSKMILEFGLGLVRKRAVLQWWE